MRKELKLLLPMVLALAMAGAVAYRSFKISEQFKALPRAHATPVPLSKNAEQFSREVIQKALVLGWEDGHHDLTKALEIGRERLPKTLRAFERSCEAAADDGGVKASEAQQ